MDQNILQLQEGIHSNIFFTSILFFSVPADSEAKTVKIIILLILCHLNATLPVLYSIVPPTPASLPYSSDILTTAPKLGRINL